MFTESDTEMLLELDELVRQELVDSPWAAQADQMDLTTPMEDRVTFYQQLRRAEVLPKDAAFFLVAWAIEEVAQERALELHDRQFAERFSKLEEKYHLDPDRLDDEGMVVPEEYAALDIEFAQVVKSLAVATFQSFGEHKMAAMYNTQPQEFDRHCDGGYTYFFGESDEDFDNFTDAAPFHD